MASEAKPSEGSPDDETHPPMHFASRESAAPPLPVCGLSHVLLALIATLPLAVDVPANVNVIITASACVYLGCYRSVKPEPPQEAMTQKDAMRFPIMGSAILLSLFVTFKLLPKEYVNAVLSFYFVLLGTIAITAVILPFVAPFVPPRLRRIEFGAYNVKIPFLMPDPTDLTASVPELAGGALALVFCVWYVAKKHWLANNVLGLAFSVQGIECISVGSFQVGLILLWGLFFYDIFWVFFTPVMVSVAKNFDAPIKLLFPRPGDEEKKFSLLGLGDIVIPGIFVALVLRYDAMRHAQARRAAAGSAAKAKAAEDDEKKSDEQLAKEEAEELAALIDSPSPYFWWCYGGYVLGLGTTIVVMNVFDAAQPALLYIVPGVVGAVMIKALIDGNLKDLYNFSEDGSTGGEAEEAEAEKDK